MSLGNLAAAEQNVRQAVELAPADAKSQLLLGIIHNRLGRKSEAESHYKAAISADPILSEPYYNLALLCSRGKRLDEARNYYQQALERGAVPDPLLEQRLAQP
jgi:pentatricopeptide repeat protein